MTNEFLEAMKEESIIRFVKGGTGSGENIGHPFRGNQYTSIKDPAEMSPVQINKEYEKLQKQEAIIIDKLIEAGRGQEKYNETVTKDDELSKEYVQIENRIYALRNEVEIRTGMKRIPMETKGYKARKVASNS